MVVVKRFFAASAFLLLLCLCTAVEAQDEMAPYPPYPLFMSGYTSIKVFDSQSRFVGRILPEKRYWASIDQIPVFLQNALVAIEDSRFYEHGAIDMRGVTRALVQDVIKRRLAEGGSTITQQLIKNKYLSGEKTLTRKVRESIMALDYERKYSKRQILEMYFNEVYFGNGAWGIVQAARLYFDKYPQDLTDAESALLAAVPKAPSRYNPLGKPLIIRDRKNLVLKRMKELKMITAGQENKLRNQRISVVQPGDAPYYLNHIRNKLIERYGAEIIERGGLEVTTAMDVKLQRLAEQVLRKGVGRISSTLQGAIISLNPNTGDILAFAGGTDFNRSSYNRAFSAKRQPGSAIKPLIYAAALGKGITAGSIWNDAPVSYIRNEHETWSPKNYGNEHYGNLSLRKALAHSDNIIAVKLLEAIGVQDFIRFAGSLGLDLRLPNDLSLALGTDEVTLSDLMLAYAPLANGGARPEPRTIIRIYDRYRNSWAENPAVVNQVLSPAIAYVATSMLKDVLIYGTAKSLQAFSREHPAAGKTGTTDGYRDAWFIGYTPELITGVWAGYDKPKPMGKGFTGGAVCAPIWEQFMRVALAGKPAIDFSKPDSVVSVQIDPATGDLAAPDFPNKQEEFYIEGTQPTAYDPNHVAAPELVPKLPDSVAGENP
ncbi:MAG: PBP1A family penicillin-binding protein [Syntrophales bacterium LBB04]|nr:PBP1A family penicillin-binding protein [Syntrophales bacterium LBB04]